MTCMYHNPINRMPIPVSTPQVMTRSCGSFFLSWSKISMASSFSRSSSFDFPVGSKTGFARVPIAQGADNPIEEPEPERRHDGAGQVHDQPLPEGKPSDQRLAAGIDQEQQSEYRHGSAGRQSQHHLRKALLTQNEA